VDINTAKATYWGSHCRGPRRGWTSSSR
jgi:hypothetical protein